MKADHICTKILVELNGGLIWSYENTNTAAMFHQIISCDDAVTCTTPF